MSDFEKWFAAQDFYTNMRFIHGDKLFDKDGDVYRVLPVQMTYLAWSEQRQRTKDKFVSITQEWHTKGWNNRQEEVDGLKAEIKKLRILVGQAGCDIDAYQEGISELKTRLAVYKEDMQRDAEKIGEALTWLTRTDIRAINMAREILQCGDLKALRGAND